jgi:hypothetical protein
MKLRLYIPEDHATLAQWWEGHGWPVVSAAILPQLGVIAEGDIGDVAAGFAYMDNSVGVAMLEWVVTNPKASPMQSLRGINAVVDFLKTEVKTLGYGVMLTSCRQQSLVKVYERAGFAKTDENVTHLLTIL